MVKVKVFVRIRESEDLRVKEPENLRVQESQGWRRTQPMEILYLGGMLRFPDVNYTKVTLSQR